MIALASFLILVLVMLITNRVATLALVATGLPSDIARFQARSALSGVGYTTVESETIVSHPARRRIVAMLMLIGNAGLVTIVAALVSTFASASNNPSAVLVRLIIAAAGLAVILLAARSSRVQAWATPIMVRGLRRWTDLDVRDMTHLMQLTNEYAVSEVFVEQDGWLADRNLAQLDLPVEGVLVLAVQRADGQFHGAPRGDTKVYAGDTVILYGRDEILTELSSRPADYRGDRAHIEAAEEHRARRQEEE